MNLLTEFISNLPAPEAAKIAQIPLRGVQEEVWNALQLQIKSKNYNKDAITDELKISQAHFDKIISELLLKCYKCLCPDEGISLLDFLAKRSFYHKHFYHELKRQIKHAQKTLANEALGQFYKSAMNLIHRNMLIMHKDIEQIKALGEAYVKLAPKEEQKDATLLLKCRLIYTQIDYEFAAGNIKAKEELFTKRLNTELVLHNTSNEEIVYEYFLTRIYFFHGLEQFNNVLKIVDEATLALQRFDTALKRTFIKKLLFKKSEALYYMSRFDEAFQLCKELMEDEECKEFNEIGYFTTKFIQICLITGQLDKAKEVVEGILLPYGTKIREQLAIRDVINFSKYYLFAKQFDKAFEFIQLGFEKNPKAKYFQYEIELRNLQTAYFYLSGKKNDAVEMCDKHIKFLRSHGYGVRDSSFPHFYIVIKSLFAKHGKLPKKEQEMFDRYQLGSYGVYGQLLEFIRKAS